ncbi:MAG: mechanosensitive ion channel family protein [Candidatus Altiarchaeota archaeon]|nr:mechanosensitive ion channel family protein [Candidatus Altiarchaeota archaeon]
MAFEMLSETFFGNTLYDYSLAFAIVLIFALFGRIFYYISNSYFKKQAAKTATKYDDLLIDALEEPAVLLIIGLGMVFGIRTLNIENTYWTLALHIVTSIFVLSGVWALVRVIDIFLKEYMGSIAKKSNTKLDDQLLPVLRKGLKLTVILIGALVIFSNFGVDITALIAGLGIGGLALALAAKDTVENLFGAFAIFFDKPFSVGDRVVVDGVTGDVMEVGLRSTRIRTLNNTQLYIPNSKVVMSNLENISRPNHSIAQTITLTLTYATSPKKIREAIVIVKKILSTTEGVSDKYEPTVIFNEFASSSLNILVKFWIVDYRGRQKVINEVNTKILEQFTRAKLEFAYPTQTVHLKK